MCIWRGKSLDILEYPFSAADILQKKRRIKKELVQSNNLLNKKIAILSGSTIGDIKNITELFLLNNGIAPLFYEGDYGLFYENTVFDDGSIAEFKPDFIYIHTTRKNLKFSPTLSQSIEEIKNSLEKEFLHFKTVYDAALSFGCPVIINNFELPPTRVMGNRDAYDPHGEVNYINKLNIMVSDYVSLNDNIHLNDIAYLASLHGLDSWFNSNHWYLYKYGLAMEKIPYLSHSIALIIKSLLGKNKKSLVLDLDYTLWGGIIGDDGIEGISVGNENPVGMVYYEFQKYLKQLADIGIVLNVASKNEFDVAKSGFSRDSNLLKFEDFISFKAGWGPKSESVKDIASELNIGLDSLVFVDDNPAEREIVKQFLPDVSIANFNGPEDMIKSICNSGYFEMTTISDDDIRRNEMYQENMQRTVLEKSVTNYDDYLKSLEMSCYISPFSIAHSERLTQLANKTNQFNLTTRRYTSSEIASITDSNEDISIYGRLTDKFGDNGIVTEMIGHIQHSICTIELWIMSCRVFKRRLEEAMLDEFIHIAISKGVETVYGTYIPSAKNMLTADLYEKMGFTLISTDDKGEKSYALNLQNGYVDKCDIISITLNNGEI